MRMIYIVWVRVPVHGSDSIYQHLPEATGSALSAAGARDRMECAVHSMHLSYFSGKQGDESIRFLLDMFGSRSAGGYLRLPFILRSTPGRTLGTSRHLRCWPDTATRDGNVAKASTRPPSWLCLHRALIGHLTDLPAATVAGRRLSLIAITGRLSGGGVRFHVLQHCLSRTKWTVIIQSDCC